MSALVILFRHIERSAHLTDGTPRPPNTFPGNFVAYARRHKMPKIRFHDVRHTHATQLLKQGVHPKIVSYTVTCRGFGSFQGSEPYIVVIVRLDEGVEFVSDLMNCGLGEAHIGMRVESFRLPLDGGTHLVLFQPAQT